MGKKGGSKAGAGSGKGEKRKNKSTSKKYSMYVIDGNSLKRKNTTCPKCGPGVYMAAHKDRNTCGKCAYTEKKTT